MKSTGKLTRKIGKQEFEVTSSNKDIFQLPASKKERLDMLKTFVTKECGRCWATMDSRVATLKRQYLYELLDKISN